MNLKFNHACSILFLLLFPLSFLWGQANNKISSNTYVIESSGWSKTNALTSTSAIIFQDDMNGDNSVSELEARGWVVNNFDGGGLTSAWYSGSSLLFFDSFEGTPDGYVASDYTGANSGLIDHWLISPIISTNNLDTLSFYMRGLATSVYDDSIYIYLSPNGGSSIADFSLVYDDGSNTNRYLVPTNSWFRWTGIIPITGNIRFAIRYHLSDADTYGEYIGIDYIQVLSSGGVVNYPQTITLATTQSFGDPTQSSSFRMIGLPGNNNVSISQYLTGNSGTDWVAFYDNGSATDYLEGFNSTSTFNFSPGKGFWILSKNNFSVNQQVNTVTLAGDNSYSIPLHNGWNIISNPFEINVSWASVRAVNSITENLHDFNGSYLPQTANMIPYKGYYYFNAGNAPTLKIPYVQSVIAKNTDQNENKSLKISLLANGISKSFIEIGFDENAKNSYDELDKFSPPGDFDDYSLSITNNNLETSYKYLISDFRKAIESGQTFDVTIKSKPKEKIVLKIEGAGNFQDYNILMIGETNSKVFDLRKSSEFEIQQNSKINNYKLVIGTDEFVENIQSEIIPEEFSLSQNYPNPLNPETIIKYSIAKKSFVSIKIFDVLGNEVSNLVNEILSPGNYEASFNGRDLSSGVYFYRLETSEYIQTKKMILLK